MTSKKQFIKKIVKKHKCLNNQEKKSIAIMLTNMSIKINETTDKTRCFVELSEISLEKLEILHKSINKYYEKYRKSGDKMLK